MKIQEGMSINPQASAKGYPDTPVEWYDFGGGIRVAPNVPPLILQEPFGKQMAALFCVKNEKFYFKVLEGNLTEEDLPSMFKKYASAFSAEVESKAQKETQQ
jgi:hypothetical protein